MCAALNPRYINIEQINFECSTLHAKKQIKNIVIGVAFGISDDNTKWKPSGTVCT
jgi:hypothetical protein